MTGAFACDASAAGVGAGASGETGNRGLKCLRWRRRGEGRLPPNVGARAASEGSGVGHLAVTEVSLDIWYLESLWMTGTGMRCEADC